MSEIKASLFVLQILETWWMTDKIDREEEAVSYSGAFFIGFDVIWFRVCQACACAAKAKKVIENWKLEKSFNKVTR